MPFAGIDDYPWLDFCSGRNGPVPVETGSGEHPARLRVGVIGPGRAGTALARALASAGHRVVAAHAISENSIQRVRDNFRHARLALPEQVVEDADLVLLTVPDDDLPGLVRGLAETGAPLAGRMLVHASGRFGVRVLDPAMRQGALPMALHPVMTFAGREDDLDRIKGTCFGVTAPEPLRAVAEVLVIEMGGEPVLIEEESRPLYHAALELAANQVAAVIAESADLLGQSVAGQSAAVPPGRILGPLVAAAVDNAVRLGDAALTGPVVRGDAECVASDMAALAAAAPGALGAYRTLARLTADRALAAGLLRPADAARLIDVLGDK
jgi:predicted short-subunit dehydrogenase-like oxidoreductase (DUF2520 family)